MASAGEIYKWVDKDGVTHYGNAPPPQEQSQSEVVDVRVSQPWSKPYLPAKQATTAAVPTTNTAAPDASKQPMKNETSTAEPTKDESAEAKRVRANQQCEENNGVDCKSERTVARTEKQEEAA